MLPLHFKCLKTGAPSATPTVTSLRNWTSHAPQIFFRLSLVIQIARRLSSHRGGWLSDNYYNQIIINKTDHNYGWPSTADNQIVLSGLAAVWQNKRTGLFQFLGEHNGRPVFVCIIHIYLQLKEEGGTISMTELKNWEPCYLKRMTSKGQRFFKGHL